MENQIAAATGVQNAIVFHQQGEPVDVSIHADHLTASDAVRLALLHDPRIQASLARLRIAEADANQARLLPNPILTIDVRVPTAAGSNTAFEATLAGDLVQLLQKPGMIQAADRRLRGSAAEALTTALDVIGEVQEAYASAASIEQEIANAKERSALLERLRTLSQHRLTAGEAPRLEVLTLDVQRMHAEMDLADLELQRRQSMLTLVRLIGAPGGSTDWTLDPAGPSYDISLPDEQECVRIGLARRPEIVSRIWELKALGADLDAAAFSPFLGGELGAHAEHDPEWRIGPTLSFPIPIFDFGQATRAKIEAQTVLARHQLTAQQREIVQDVRSAYASYLNAREALLRTRDTLLPLQKQQLDMAQRQFLAGDADIATWLLAESDYQLTQSKFIELQEKTTVALMKLQRAVGGAAVLPQAATAPATSPTTNPSTSQPATGATR